MNRSVVFGLTILMATIAIPIGEADHGQPQDWRIDIDEEGSTAVRLTFSVLAPTRCMAAAVANNDTADGPNAAIFVGNVWDVQGVHGDDHFTAHVEFVAQGTTTLRAAIIEGHYGNFTFDGTTYTVPPGRIAMHCEHPFTIHGVDRGNEAHILTTEGDGIRLPTGVQSVRQDWMVEMDSVNVDLVSVMHVRSAVTGVNAGAATISADAAYQTPRDTYEWAPQRHPSLVTEQPAGTHEIEVSFQNYGQAVDWYGLLLGLE